MKTVRKSLLAIALASAIVPTAAYAQIEEVLVTAQKQAQSLQDVPIAISVVDEELIKNTGVNTVNDLTAIVPGFSGNQPGLVDSTWSIRGISSNDYGLGSEDAVGVYFDDAFLGRGEFKGAAFFDVSRVEVIKGPQGTLFGRNASAGAISIVSNKPSDEYELNLGIQAGNEGQRRYSVVGNLPATDSFALRLAYEGERFEGHMYDANNQEFMNRERDSARLMARLNPTENFQAILRLDYGEATTNYNSPISTLLNEFEPGVKNPDKYGLTKPNVGGVDKQGAGLRISWDLSDELSLTSISDYRSSKSVYREDADGSSDDVAVDLGLTRALFSPGAPTGLTGAMDTDNMYRTNGHTFYQEFRLNSFSESFDWFAGISYYKEKFFVKNDVDLLDLDLSPTDPTGTTTNPIPFMYRKTSGSDNEAHGVYVDGTWRATDRLTLLSGIRWSYDDKGWCADTPVDTIGVSLETDGELCRGTSWEAWTPRFVAQYHLDDETMVFGSVAWGYKGGGHTEDSVDTDSDGIGDTLYNFDPETNTNYEIGIKSSLLEGLMQLNGAVFYNEYEDLQVLTAKLEGIFIANEGTAVSQGAEVELMFMPAENLTLIANYAYLDAEMTDGQYKGYTTPYAPDFTFTVGADYFHEFQGGYLNWFVMYNYTDNIYHDIEKLYDEPSYGLLNARVSYTPQHENWELAFAIDNIEDQDYAISRLDLEIGTGEMAMWGSPRLIRAEFNIQF